jgi:hypothetical protein
MNDVFWISLEKDEEDEARFKFGFSLTFADDEIAC